MEDHHPIVVEESFNHPASVIWAALTERDQMIQWFFENIPAFLPEVGFNTTFPVVSGDRTFTHHWMIQAVTPEEKIVYHWSYEEYPGEGFVTFLISPQDDECLVSITNEGLETFPQDIPEFARENCENGWKYFMGRLKAFLD